LDVSGDILKTGIFQAIPQFGHANDVVPANIDTAKQCQVFQADLPARVVNR